MDLNPKIVSTDPLEAAIAGLIPNAAKAEEMVGAVAEAPELLRSLGIEHPDDLYELEIGRGAYARAFRTPGGKILKLTTDDADARVSELVRQAGDVPGLVKIYDVRRLPAEVPDTQSRIPGRAPRSESLYVIVAEPVDTLDGMLEAIEEGEATESLRREAQQLQRAVNAVATAERRAMWDDPQKFLRTVFERDDRYPLDESGVMYANDLAQGALWAAERGYGVIGDMHGGNVGLNREGDAVILDLGLSAGAKAKESPIPLAANLSGSGSKVDRVFDETFDVVEKRFPDLGAIELYEDEVAGSDNGAGSERQFAYCMDGNPIQVAFAPKAEALPLNRLRGLMRHEFGHALEFRYGVAELQKRLGRRLPEYSERRADVVAECVFGEPILYDHANVQCVRTPGAKKRRPRHLPDKKEKLKPNRGPWAPPMPEDPDAPGWPAHGPEFRDWQARVLAQAEERFGDVPRIALSAEPIEAIRSTPPSEQSVHLKPRGFWYGCGLEWIRHLVFNDPRDMGSYVYGLDVDLSRMAVIQTAEELDAFTARFGEPDEEGDPLIDWRRVALYYAGIEVCPYVPERKNVLWYAAWDVASGCVWDVNAIRGFFDAVG